MKDYFYVWIWFNRINIKTKEDKEFNDSTHINTNTNVEKNRWYIESIKLIILLEVFDLKMDIP